MTTPVRAILADDEPLIRRGLRLMLEAGGTVSVVAEAADGAELLKVSAEHDPDVVLVDVRMPGVGGLTALAELGAKPDPPAMAVLTTFDLDDYVTEALRLGAQGFLLKDAEAEVLVRAVLDLAAGGAVLDPRVAARLVPKLRNSSEDKHQLGLVASLVAREHQVLGLLTEGKSNAAIAEAMGLTEKTVKSYVSSVISKLGVSNRVQAALVGQRAGL